MAEWWEDNFLTQGREALIEDLKASTLYDARIKAWFEFGGGLRRRLLVDRAHCPYCAVYPIEGEESFEANVLRSIPHLCQVEFGAARQNAGQVEALQTEFYDVLKDAREDHLGLTGEGLTAIEVSQTTYEMRPDKDGSELIWTVANTVVLRFNRS